MAGAGGLLRDKTRPSRIPPLGNVVAERVVAQTLTAPAGEVSHWTAAAMAKDCGISASSVHRIWRGHGLRPHQVRQFKLSNDPNFAAKLRDIVGLYVAPPAHAVVLSIDEKSQIQALDRTQPGLPLKKGRCGTMTHYYIRNGTTTLFAALDVADGKVIGRCMQRHRHQEFVRFLNAIEAEVPKGKAVHVILDNYATHKHPKVVQWLGRATTPRLHRARRVRAKLYRESTRRRRSGATATGRCFRIRAGTAEQHPHAGDQTARREGRGDKIVGTELKSQDAIYFLAARCQHDDWHAAELTQPERQVEGPDFRPHDPG